VDKYRRTFAGYSLAMQISGTLLCSVFCSLGSGIWLDRKLGTTPWLMLVLMVVGLGFGMYTIYNIVTEANKKS
jgi:F0F1-type ATP synthase assembly protein I